MQDLLERDLVVNMRLLEKGEKALPSIFAFESFDDLLHLCHIG